MVASGPGPTAEAGRLARLLMPSAPAGNDLREKFSTLHTDPGLLPQKLDLVTRRALFIEMDRERYLETPFLDDRMVDQNTQGFWATLESIPPPETPRSARWLFHTGHCGSTLLSRLLPAICPLLPVREPPALRTLAEARRLLGQPLSRLDPSGWRSLFRNFVALYSRTFGESAALIKTSSDCVNLVRESLDEHPDSRGILMFQSLEIYLTTMLVGPDPRMDIEGHAVSRLMDLHEFLGDRDSLRLFELTPVQRVVISWLAGVSGLHQALRDCGNRLRFMDFDAFIREPGEGLASLSGFFGSTAEEGRIREVLSGPLMQTYAKAPEYRFSPADRARQLAENRRRSSKEIDEGLRWADELVKRFESLGPVVEVFPLTRSRT